MDDSRFLRMANAGSSNARWASINLRMNFAMMLSLNCQSQHKRIVSISLQACDQSSVECVLPETGCVNNSIDSQF